MIGEISTDSVNLHSNIVSHQDWTYDKKIMCTRDGFSLSEE